MSDEYTLALETLLYACVQELDYVQSAEDHSQCASANGKMLIQRGMATLGVDDLEAETWPKAKERFPAEYNPG